jgi:hypothetical protein
MAAQQFQFGLRTMLLWVAALGVLFAVLAKVGPVWQATIVWFLVLIAVHVVANAWGSRSGSRRLKADESAEGSPCASGASAPQTPRFAPTTRLGATARLGRTPLAVTLIGLLLGGLLGTIAFAIIAGQRSGLAGVAVAGTSSAVVGGFLAFLSSSFLQTAVQAFREAARGAHSTDAARAIPTKYEPHEIRESAEIRANTSTGSIV